MDYCCQGINFVYFHRKITWENVFKIIILLLTMHDFLKGIGCNADAWMFCLACRLMPIKITPKNTFGTSGREGSYHKVTNFYREVNKK